MTRYFGPDQRKFDRNFLRRAALPELISPVKTAFQRGAAFDPDGRASYHKKSVQFPFRISTAA
jgi:hypothetical protein